nr:unnamed protein product [Spirometra erinaceieuropaei]
MGSRDTFVKNIIENLAQVSVCALSTFGLLGPVLTPGPAFEKGETANHFTELTEKQFIHNLRSMINGDFRHQIDQFGWTFFKAVDIEGTGYISMTEYRNLQEAWRVGRGEAEGMFKVLDTDKDGKISSDEYLSAWVEYFLGEDTNSPYKTFFGPVIFKPAQGQ